MSSVGGLKLITDTKMNMIVPVHMEYLGKALVQKTGLQGGSPVIEGVITDTLSGLREKSVPELHKVHHVGKTQAKRLGQVPYSGKLY